MAKFDFSLVGSPSIRGVEVAASGIDEVVSEVEATRFLIGKLDSDEWGQVRRVPIRSDRIQVIVEAD